MTSLIHNNIFLILGIALLFAALYIYDRLNKQKPFKVRTGPYMLHQVRGTLYHLTTLTEGSHVTVEKKLLVAICKSLDKTIRELEKQNETTAHP